MTYARRTDSTHHAIVKALKQMGWLVCDLSRVGSGVPDLLIYRPATRRWALIEAKSAKGKLKPLQEAFIALGWPVQIVRSVEEAVRLT